MDNSILKFSDSVIKLLYAIATQEPLVFIFLIVILIGYYYCRSLILTKLRKKLNLWQKKEGEQSSSLLRSAVIWPVMLILHLFEFVFVIGVALYFISPKWLNESLPQKNIFNSFKNEPTGFRRIKFKTDIQNFLSFYPNAQRIENINLKDLQVYLVSGEQFFDWNDVNIKFVFYKNRFYQVAIDYTPIAFGNEIDTEVADRAADNLMLNRATEYYGSPELYEENGFKLYIWRGYNGAVTLDTVNNILAIIDSQLLIEYQASSKKHGP